jgi:hypothetical protein
VTNIDFGATFPGTNMVQGKNTLGLDWMNMIVVKLGWHKERHKKWQECDIMIMTIGNLAFSFA